MKRNALLSVVLIVSVLNPCVQGFSQKKWKGLDNVLFIAWNEDTVKSYKVIVTREMNFYLNIKSDTANLEQIYNGNISKPPSGDTIYLNYYKNLGPVGFKNYILIEISGSYLILIKENGKRIFMR